MSGGKITVPFLREMKKNGEKIVALTAYDYPTARLMDACGIDIILVGDSVGNVVLGYENTLPVTMDEMLHHVKAVCRATKDALVVADMPFLSYQTGKKTAIENAGRLLKEGGANAVKLEGGAAIAQTVADLVSVGIPVMGHLGLTPQSINLYGGYVKQAKSKSAQDALLEEALVLEEAGAFSIVLELVSAEAARKITEAVSIPTIGIGSGAGCDGQVLVVNDMLGLDDRFTPKHAKQYAILHKIMKDAFKAYGSEVRAGKFPPG